MNDRFDRIETHLKTMVEKFKRDAYNFFSESDAHSYLYLSLYRDREFSQSITTADSRRTIALHREYPTFFKYKKVVGLKECSDGTRGHYDLAILNPTFINANTFPAVTNRKGSIEQIRPAKPIDAAIEFKLAVGRVTKGYLNEIEMDFQKLTASAKDASSLYFIILNQHDSMTSDNYAKIRRFAAENPIVRAVYIESFIDNGEKVYRGEYFGDWIKKAGLPAMAI